MIIMSTRAQCCMRGALAFPHVCDMAISACPAGRYGSGFLHLCAEYFTLPAARLLNMIPTLHLIVVVIALILSVPGPARAADTKPVTGTMTLGKHVYNLAHVVAFETKYG